MTTLCYIVNLSYTTRDDRYITVWRPDDRGYCWALSRAGRYGLEDVLKHAAYYNSGYANVAVPCEVVDALGVGPIKGHHDNDTGPCVENTKENWRRILAAVVAVPQEKPRPEYWGGKRSARATAGTA